MIQAVKAKRKNHANRPEKVTGLGYGEVIVEEAVSDIARANNKIRPGYSVNGKKLGRPRNQYTKAQIEEISECAFMGCQTATIARIVGIEESQIREHFTDLLEQKRAERKRFLRTQQTNQTTNNPVMAIFLGKNELGQADKQEIDVNASRLPESTEELRALLAEREAREARVKAIVANIEADNA